MEKFKYVPVFRYRSQERKAINSTSLSNKIVPLIEIVTKKPTLNSKKDSIEQLLLDFQNNNSYVMVDIPMYIKLKKSTTRNVMDFLAPVLANPKTRIDILTDKRLVNNGKIIPVITYNPNNSIIPNYLTYQTNQLKKYYNKVAYRIYPNGFETVMNELSKLINTNDILIFDLDETPYTAIENRAMFKRIQQLSSIIHFRSVILQSAIPKSLTNVNLNHCSVIKEADNSLLKSYKKIGFSAFGDYCGVKKDDLTSGGIISPGYIKYSWMDNSYYGFKGTKEEAETFESIVAPAIIHSNVWSNYNKVHKENCLGCKNIQNIYNKIKKGKSQPEWKGFACGHYLYTMEEFL
ncbi:beta family protein [Bacillus safensis]